jgi:DinB superfamily
MPLTMFGRPGAGENAPYYDSYIRLVPAGDLIAIMSDQMSELDRLFRQLGESRASYRYAADKWSVKQVLGHLVDTERVFAFRATVFSRNDPGPLPSFDQAAWIAAADYDSRTLVSILDEWLTVRRASLAMVSALSETALERRGVASDLEFSARAAICILPGHVLYHLARLRSDYHIG